MSSLSGWAAFSCESVTSILSKMSFAAGGDHFCINKLRNEKRRHTHWAEDTLWMLNRDTIWDKAKQIIKPLLQCQLCSDLICDLIYSYGGGRNTSRTLIESASTGRKVITLPAVLICDLTLLVCYYRADRGMQARMWLSKSSGVNCDLCQGCRGLIQCSLFVSGEEKSSMSETSFRSRFHCRVNVLKLPVVVACSQNRVY